MENLGEENSIEVAVKTATTKKELAVLYRYKRKGWSFCNFTLKAASLSFYDEIQLNTLYLLYKCLNI